ncbi:MAG: hypothetical protein ABJO36_05920 [Litorimonas sp.]
MFYNSFYKSVIFSGVILAGGAASAKAQTPLVRNPLYDLKPEICEIDMSQLDKDRIRLASKVVPVTKDLTKSNANLGDEGGQTVFWKVEVDHLVEKILSRYPVEVSYADLLKPDATYKQLLTETLIPCKGASSPLPENCEDPKRYTNSADRFDEKPNALRFRRALLRLFETAETGTSRDFVVIRRPFVSFDVKRNLELEKEFWGLEEVETLRENLKRNEQSYREIATDPVKQILTNSDSIANRELQSKWTPFTYRPLVDAGADDVIINRFLNDTQNPPFVILCRSVEITELDPNAGQKDDSDTNKALRKKVSRKTHFVTADSPAYPIDQETGSDTVNTRVENALLDKSFISSVGESLNNFKSGKTWSSKNNEDAKHSIRPTLVKNPRQFGRSSPDAASIGLSLIGDDVSDTDDNDDNDRLVIDAALGLTYEYTPKKSSEASNKLIQTFRGTLFGAISQAPTDFAFMALADPDDPTNLEVVEADKKIAFADISYGARFEYERKGPIIPPNFGQRTGLTHSSLIGQRWPGTRAALTIEGVKDNFEFQRGKRIGLDFSLPKRWAWGYFPGFRQKQELIRRNPLADDNKQRLPNPLGYGRLATGWSIEWDLQPAFDYLTWDKGRAPFDFETHNPRDRIQEQSLEGVIYGGNLEFDLYKSNLFGGVLKDSYFNFSTDYLFRRGYNVFIEDDTLPIEEQMLTPKRAGHLTLAATISHPDFSNLSYGVTWETGKDIRTLSDADTLSITFGAKY